MRLFLVVTFLVCAGLAAQAQAASSAKVVCGQIKHGPYAAWTVQTTKGPINLKGTTWTVLEPTLVSCAQAMKVTPGVLAEWAKAKLGQRLKPPSGFAGCMKLDMPAPGGRRASGGGQCYTASGGGFRFLMTGRLTKAQIQALIV